MLEELGQNGNDINYCCKLLVVQSKYFAQFVGFVISPNVAAFSSCKVSVYLERKHQPPQHTQCIVFPTGNSGTLTQESQFSWYLQVAETHLLWQFIAFQNLTYFECNSANLFFFANYG